MACNENEDMIHKLLTHCKYGHEFTNENTIRNAKGFRHCKTCQRKRSTEWSKTKKAKDGSRRYYLNKTYGITEELKLLILENQNNECAICHTCLLNKIGIDVHIDHDHDNNRIRGILCKNCNNALGLFRDSINILNNAIKYLAIHKKNEMVVKLAEFSERG